MKSVYKFSFSFFLLANYMAAQSDQISVGAGYADQSFYRIHDGSVTTYSADVWDIAFDLDGIGLGIYVNEAAISSMTGAAPEVALYVSQDTAYTAIDTIGKQRIFNNDHIWGIRGI